MVTWCQGTHARTDPLLELNRTLLNNFLAAKGSLWRGLGYGAAVLLCCVSAG